MELGIATLQPGLVFLWTFTTTLAILWEPNNRVERSVWYGLRNLVKVISARLVEMISVRVDAPDETPTPRDRLSDETWQRVLQVHMINAAPSRRM